MNMSVSRNILVALLAVAVISMATHVSQKVIAVEDEVRSPLPIAIAAVETEGIDVDADVIDDPAIWLHPTDPAQSLIIATDKRRNGGGLRSYRLNGEQVQLVVENRLNNVDIKYGFHFKDQTIDIVVASNRKKNLISIYYIDNNYNTLVHLSDVHVDGEIVPHGICMYLSAKSGNYYAFVTTKAGDVQQWQLLEDAGVGITGRLVRSFNIANKLEGCVADDRYGHLYVGVEYRGILKFGAEPDDGSASTVVDEVNGRLTADVEGLALYQTTDGDGYLIASSQGDSSFAVYERAGDNRFLMSFRVATADGAMVVATDGIEVSNVALGSRFPAGVFIVHDQHNDSTGTGSNIKIVPWERIAELATPPLIVDTTYNPRTALHQSAASD